MNVSNHILAVNHNGFESRHAQRDVQDGSIFGAVYFVAAKQCFDSRRKGALPGQSAKKCDCFAVDSVLGVVQE